MNPIQFQKILEIGERYDARNPKIPLKFLLWAAYWEVDGKTCLVGNIDHAGPRIWILPAVL